MINIRRITFLLIFVISILSCNTNNKIEHKNEPTIYEVQIDDAEMNKAMNLAKQTLDSFDYAFKNNSRIFTFFGLKKRFEQNGAIEHIWIGNIKLENGKYIGIIDNLPEKIETIKLGDTIEIDRKNISDWMYIKNSKLYGGYTIRLLRNRMSETEKEIFDKESKLKM